jgi:hypothetical protein
MRAGWQDRDEASSFSFLYFVVPHRLFSLKHALGRFDGGNNNDRNRADQPREEQVFEYR